MRDWAKLHADISKSQSFAAVANEDPTAALLFLMMLPRADVLGIVDAHPLVFRGEVCPRLNVTEEDIERCFGVLVRADMIVVYEDNKGDRWLWVRNWHKFQEVRWSHVGATNRPLPDCWESPDGLARYMTEHPEKPLSQCIKLLRENSCSTTENDGSTPATQDVVLLENYSSTPATKDVVLLESYRTEVETETEREREQRTDSPPNDGGAPHGQRKELPDQVAIREAFESIIGKPLPKGRLKGYPGLREHVKRRGIPLLKEWAAFSGGESNPVPNGADDWKWFCTAASEALRNPFVWQKERDKWSQLQPGQLAGRPIPPEKRRPDSGQF